MFRCQLCSCVAPPRTRARRVVVATRQRQYPFRRDANLVRWAEYSNGSLKHKERRTDDPGGTGREIVRELLACPACAARFALREEAASLTGGASEGTGGPPWR